MRRLQPPRSPAAGSSFLTHFPSQARDHSTFDCGWKMREKRRRRRRKIYSKRTRKIYSKRTLTADAVRARASERASEREKARARARALLG